jgi:hypothetical protein
MDCGEAASDRATKRWKQARQNPFWETVTWEAPPMARTPRKKSAARPYVITTLFDRPHVRVTHTVMQPNAVIPKHTHEQEYTIFPLTDLNVKRVYHRGDRVIRTVNVVVKKGQHYVAKATRPGTHISIVNNSNKRMEFEKTFNPSAGSKSPRRKR